MKHLFFTVLTFKPWLVNTFIILTSFAVWWIIYGFAKCEYPNGSVDQIPWHGRLILSVLSTAVVGLLVTEVLAFFRALRP